MSCKGRIQAGHEKVVKREGTTKESSGGPQPDGIEAPIFALKGLYKLKGQRQEKSEWSLQDGLG